MAGRGLFWHRRDLRFSDNLSLAAAAAITPALTGVFVLEPAQWQGKQVESLIAPARRWFLAESLVELQQRWQAAGSRLLILEGDPLELLPQLAAQLKVERVHWNRELAPCSRQRDRQVAARLQADGRQVLVEWDQLLVGPDQLRTGAGDPYRVYGPFFRKWRALVEELKPVPLKAPLGLLDLSSQEEGALKAGGWLQQCSVDLASLRRDHGFAGLDLCPCRPGEAAAQSQLQLFCDGGALLSYELGRNLPADSGTSGLGAAFRFGTISARQAWEAAQSARLLARSEEQLRSIQIWEQELAWREFYQHALFHFPELAKGPYRPHWRKFPWQNNRLWFEAWRDGMTGMPIIDAAMRQLRQSGWMHNRCRMIVASFLVKDLICNWRWGEQMFMEHLVDGDLAANNGGWQWSASSGMDPKPLRIFNPATQAGKFDADASYIRRWLPELAHVATADLISGDLPALERRGYPEALVNHKLQQARFKVLYAEMRNG